MGVLTPNMRRMVEAQQLGFVATVCPDGTPNLSPKGTLAVWDDSHLVFADIRSPATIANLRERPAVEINVIDALTRKGYRFKGAASVLDAGPVFDAAIAFYAARGSATPKRHIVLVKIEKAAPVVSPAYDQGRTESAVVAQWRRYWATLWG